jgi:Domain of unknown function (DUF6985)
MFGLFKSEPVLDLQLGELRRSGGHWRGSLELVPCGTFRLSLAGSRKAPDAAALRLAKELPGRFKALMPAIQGGLFEHYAPYKEAVDEGEHTESPCPNIAGAEGVWPYVTPAHVLIEPIRRGDSPTVEIAFSVEWDVEHTVAAMYRDWQFIELNGSVRGQ